MSLKKKKPTSNKDSFANQFIKELASGLSTKRARVMTKQLLKAADFSFYFAQPYLASQYVSQEAKSIHILLDQPAANELLDHGRWFVLLPFILKQPNLDVKVTILRNEPLVSEQSRFRPFVDYMIEYEHGGSFSSEIFEGSIGEMDEDALASVDLYLTPSPSKRYLANPENQRALQWLVASDTATVVLADIDRTALLFSLGAFNMFNVGTYQDIKKNPAGLNVQAHLSKELKHAGVSLKLDTLNSNVRLVNDFIPTFDQIYDASLHLTRLIHFGDSLRKLPTYPFPSPTHMYDSVVMDPKTGDVQYCVDGNQYRFVMTSLPSFFTDHFCVDDLNHQAQLCVYATIVNLAVFEEFKRLSEKAAG